MAKHQGRNAYVREFWRIALEHAESHLPILLTVRFVNCGERVASTEGEAVLLRSSRFYLRRGGRGGTMRRQLVCKSSLYSRDRRRGKLELELNL